MKGTFFHGGAPFLSAFFGGLSHRGPKYYFGFGKRRGSVFAYVAKINYFDVCAWGVASIEQVRGNSIVEAC